MYFRRPAHRSITKPRHRFAGKGEVRCRRLLLVSVLLLLSNAVACVAIVQNGATMTATANPATGRGIARHFRHFIQGTSPSRLIGQLGAGQTVNCPDGPSPTGGPKSVTEGS
jgi:hypothetical protein